MQQQQQQGGAGQGRAHSSQSGEQLEHTVNAAWPAAFIRPLFKHSCCAAMCLPLPQELAEQAAASAAAEADAGDKPTLRQRLDKAGPEEELMHNPLQLHTAVRGRWCGRVVPSRS